MTPLTNGNTRALALDAHELGTDYPIRAEDQVVVISHRGYKRYPNRSLCRATEAGAETMAIVGRVAPEQQAKQTIRTCDNERAGTFSASYLASFAVLAKLVAKLDGDPAESFAKSLARLPDDLAKTLESPLRKDLVTPFPSRSQF